jgi:N-acetylglutamate synthase-like GNAT family acetyltransferase
MIVDEMAGSAPDLVAALEQAGLPTADLAETGRKFFRFRDDAGRTVGFVGWEVTEGAVLLRSLVVEPERRGKGWSRAITDWALQRLGEGGVGAVYALTMNPKWAERMGFERVEREALPRGVRASRQFAGLCPETAVALRRRLTAAG